MHVRRGVHNGFHVHYSMYTPIFDIQVFAMPKLTDMQIRAWMKAGDRFGGKAGGNGLYICYPKNYITPFWRFRYKFAGKQRTMVVGSYSELSLSKAREAAKELSVRVILGCDVVAEKRERKAEALAEMEAEKNAMYVSDLASEYFKRQILPRWKHPNILRRRIDKDINPCIGYMKVKDVRPHHIDDMLKGIIDRGAPMIVTNVLHRARHIFDYGIKRHTLEINPYSAFEVSSAGGKEVSCDRWLTRDELIRLYAPQKDSATGTNQHLDYCWYCAFVR